MIIELEDLEVYQLAEEIADCVWDVCVAWDWFSKDTLGRQLVRAADSIGGNIAEGYGRFSFKETIQFCYYARGSLMETRHLLRRARKRNLLTQTQTTQLRKALQPLSPKLNAYIRSIRSQVRTRGEREPVTNDK